MGQRLTVNATRVRCPLGGIIYKGMIFNLLSSLRKRKHDQRDKLEGFIYTFYYCSRDIKILRHCDFFFALIISERLVMLLNAAIMMKELNSITNLINRQRGNIFGNM